MKTRFEQGIIDTLWPHGLRLILGIVFIYAGYIKILDPASFAKNVYQYQILPDAWVNITSLILPWLEVVCGLALIIAPRLRRGASAWLFIMLAVFTSAILASIYRGLDISCGCFSTDPNAAKIGWKKVAENTGLLLLSVIAFVQAGKHPSVRVNRM
ncbi:MAG TPA: MauE/DoxX family redox-associated membrane protein [Kiritimatiellia bacterium]|nr:MauE/DoxX family redox-associated membrane protein [Kiritimatiellia bacterium]